MAEIELGTTAQEVRDRIERFVSVVDSKEHEPRMWFARAVAKVAGALVDLGIPPPWQIIPAPGRANFSRQCVRNLQPNGYDVFSFKARKKGYLIINDIEVAPEDALGYDMLRVEFHIKGKRNLPTFQIPGPEPGMWKFRKRLLYDDEEFLVKVINTDQFGIVTYAAYFNGWEV
jgi:hypothetical protein